MAATAVSTLMSAPNEEDRLGDRGTYPYPGAATQLVLDDVCYRLGTLGEQQMLSMRGEQHAWLVVRCLPDGWTGPGRAAVPQCMSGCSHAWLEAAAQPAAPAGTAAVLSAVSLRCRPTLDPVLELLQLLMPILQQARQLCVSSLPPPQRAACPGTLPEQHLLLLIAAYHSAPSWASLPAAGFASRTQACRLHWLPAG